MAAAHATRRSTRRAGRSDSFEAAGGGGGGGGGGGARGGGGESGSEYHASEPSVDMNAPRGRHGGEGDDDDDEDEDDEEAAEYTLSKRGRKYQKRTYVEPLTEDDDDPMGGLAGAGTTSAGGGGRGPSSSAAGGSARKTRGSSSKAEDLFAEDHPTPVEAGTGASASAGGGKTLRRSTRRQERIAEEEAEHVAAGADDEGPAYEDDEDDDQPVRTTRRSTRAASGNLKGFVVSDDEKQKAAAAAERRRSGRSSHRKGGGGAGKNRPTGGRLTRRQAAAAKAEEEDVYVDNGSSDGSADADGSLDEGVEPSSDLEMGDADNSNEGAAGVGAGDNAARGGRGGGGGGSNGQAEEDTNDGKPYALRQRQRINYAIPPPLEEMSRPPPAHRAGGRNAGGGGAGGGGGGGGGRGPFGRGAAGYGGGGGGGGAHRAAGRKGPGWSATGADLARWMGAPLDDSDSDVAKSPKKQPFSLGALNGAPGGGGSGLAGAGGGGLLSGDLGGAAGGPSNLGKIGDAALADADPLGVNTNVTFDEIGGLDEHIHSLKEMTLLPLLYPEVFQQFNVTPPRGVLFHGPPGTGKTLLARALAASCRSNGKSISFFMRKGADCLSKWVGEAERQLRLLFEEARASQPAIIFFDEIDGLAPVRSSKQDQIHASIVSTLLALMDGMDGRGQVVVIGATNRPDAVDPALRRPGRFDREFYFGLPKVEAREKILEIMTRGWKGWSVDVALESAKEKEGERESEKKKKKEKEKMNVIDLDRGVEDVAAATATAVSVTASSSSSDKAEGVTSNSATAPAPAPTPTPTPTAAAPVSTSESKPEEDSEEFRKRKEESERARARLGGLAKLTKGYGGADLRALCTEAALNAVQRRYPQIYKSTERLLVKPEAIEVKLKDFMISIKRIVPSSARSSSSAATPLPSQFVPLLGGTLEKVKKVIARVMPIEKKLSALEEAEYEEDDEELFASFEASRPATTGEDPMDGGPEFQRELALQSMQTLRVYRPRVVLHGEVGMGQSYLGAAALHHLEGFHVQSLELGSLMGDSARTVEAAIVQLFVEAKRHQPSVIYIPSLVGWCAAVSEASRSTVRAMLDTLAPTDPILLLAIVDGPYMSVPRDVRAWFGACKDNRVSLPKPTSSERDVFFRPLLADVKRKPNEFADGMKRRKRVLEELPLAPPLEPRKPTETELMAQQEADAKTLAFLKYQLGPILTELKRKFKRFTKKASEEYDYDFNAEELEIVMEQEAHAQQQQQQQQQRGLQMNVDFYGNAAGSTTVELHAGVNGVIEIVDGPAANGIQVQVDGVELDTQPHHPPHSQQQVPHHQQAQMQLPPPGATAINGYLPTLPPPPPPPRPRSYAPRPPRLFDMDLEAMHQGLYRDHYLTPQDFLDDVGRIVHNAQVRQDQDPDRFYKAQAMFTAAEVSIMNIDPQLRAECERMAQRERQRREERRKLKEAQWKAEEKAQREEAEAAAAAAAAHAQKENHQEGVRRSARVTGQEPEMAITDPVKLERRLKRQREDGTGTGTESHHHSEDEHHHLIPGGGVRNRQVSGSSGANHAQQYHHQPNGVPVIGVDGVPIPGMHNNQAGNGNGFREHKRARMGTLYGPTDLDQDTLDLLARHQHQHQQPLHQQPFPQHSQYQQSGNPLGYAPTMQSEAFGYGQPPHHQHHQQQYPSGSAMSFVSTGPGHSSHALNMMGNSGYGNGNMIVDGYHQGMGMDKNGSVGPSHDPYHAMHQQHQQQVSNNDARRGFDALLNPMSPSEPSYKPHGLDGITNGPMGIGFGAAGYNSGMGGGMSYGHLPQNHMGGSGGSFDAPGNSYYMQQSQHSPLVPSQTTPSNAYPSIRNSLGLHIPPQESLQQQQQSYPMQMTGSSQVQPTQNSHLFQPPSHQHQQQQLPLRPLSRVSVQMSTDSMQTQVTIATAPTVASLSVMSTNASMTSHATSPRLSHQSRHSAEPQPISAVSPQRQQSIAPPSRVPSPSKKATPPTATPPAMVVDIEPPVPERPRTPLPDFHISEVLFDKLSRVLSDETSVLNVEQLEQLRATCLGSVWRHRAEWNRDELVHEMLGEIRDFVAEVKEMMEEEEEEDDMQMQMQDEIRRGKMGGSRIGGSRDRGRTSSIASARQKPDVRMLLSNA